MEEEKILNAVLPPSARWSTQKLEEAGVEGKQGEREQGNTHRGSALVQSMTYLNSKSPSDIRMKLSTWKKTAQLTGMINEEDTASVARYTILQ